MNDGVDGEIYCKSCHNGKFGMTGYGYGLGAGTLLSVRLALLGQNIYHSEVLLKSSKMIICRIAGYSFGDYSSQNERKSAPHRLN